MLWRSHNDAIHLLLQSPIAEEIVNLVDQIITIQGQISEQFPQIFENIVKENLAKNITSSLNNIYQTQSLALQNLREIEDLQTKIITSEFYMIPIYQCTKINMSTLYHHKRKME